MKKHSENKKIKDLNARKKIKKNKKFEKDKQNLKINLEKNDVEILKINLIDIPKNLQIINEQNLFESLIYPLTKE